MSSPKKLNGKKDRKPAHKKSLEKAEPSGRLVALDGTHGPSLAAESPRLARLFGGKDPAWSLFDASNTFLELGMAKAKTVTPTPRTLVLLYASDLLFRLRWEIEPTLQEGRTVVASPYVQTAVAFGVAAGLPKEWLDELFSFAPQPVVGFRLKEKKKARKMDKKAGKKNGDAEGSGFVEFACASLARTSARWDEDELRAGMTQYFKNLQEHDGIRKLGKKLPKGLGKK